MKVMVYTEPMIGTPIKVFVSSAEEMRRQEKKMGADLGIDDGLQGFCGFLEGKGSGDFLHLVWIKDTGSMSGMLNTAAHEAVHLTANVIEHMYSRSVLRINLKQTEHLAYQFEKLFGFLQDAIGKAFEAGKRADGKLKT